MLNAIIVAAVAAFSAVLAPAAAAVDLDTMGPRQKRIYCVAYGLIDLQYRYDNGGVDRAAYDRERMQLGWRIQNRGDNQTYAQDFRRLQLAGDEIIAEQPSVEALSAQAEACGTSLRM
jgi:hypothetical protein